MSITVNTEYVVEDCPSCGMEVVVGVAFQKRRRGDGRLFYCLNGHAMSYTPGKSPAEKEAERLATELTREKHLREQAEAEARWAIEARATVERRLTAAKGRIAKLAKRVAAGTCPCYEQAFPDLGVHMASAHPEFTPEREADVETETVEATLPMEQPADEDLKARGAAIRARREALDWSPGALATALGIKSGTLGLIETGHYGAPGTYLRAEQVLDAAEAGGNGRAVTGELAAPASDDALSPTPDAPNAGASR